MAQFMDLPPEVRLMIWNYATIHRTVHLTWKLDHSKKRLEGEVRPLECISSSTSIPAIVQVCREARNLGPYAKFFTQGCRPRYVWVNFDADTIDIGSDELTIVDPERSLLRRIEMFRDVDYWGSEQVELCRYPRIEELTIKTLDEFAYWGDVDNEELDLDPEAWPCPLENVWIAGPSGEERRNMSSLLEKSKLNIWKYYI